MTEAERRLWSRLRRRKVEGHYFRRQVPLGPFVLDFACMQAKLVIEVDGGQHATQESSDRSRESWLAGRGYRVVRFWNHDVLRDTDAVIVEIARQLERER